MGKLVDARQGMLRSWAGYLVRAAYQGAFTGGHPLRLQVVGIAGPRAGALEIYAGIEAPRLLSALSPNDCARLRPFIPWEFVGDPSAYMSGRYVRVEAGWPAELAETMVRLGELCQKPTMDGRWVVGKNEMGATVVAGLNNKAPHYLLAGTTGSGKSVALRSAVLQLSRDPANRIVLVDGKMGEGLGLLQYLPGVVGPVATDGPSARSALAWACSEMRQRYVTGTNGHRRLVVVIDEFQEWAGDAVFVDLLRKLAAQGRAAGVHLLAATQHPTVDAFGDASTRRNLSGKLALRVGDPDASRVAVGGRLPRADFLLGAGDAFAKAAGTCHRVQVAYVDAGDVDARGEWEFDEWPWADGEAVGQDIPDGRPFTGEELGVALLSAAEGEGRVLFQRRLEVAGMAPGGNERAVRLLELARVQLDWMRSQEVDLCAAEPTPVRPSGGALSHPRSRVISSVRWG